MKQLLSGLDYRQHLQDCGPERRGVNGWTLPLLPLTVGGGFQAAAWGGDPELNQAVLLRWGIWKGGLGGPQQNVWSAGEESIPETAPCVCRGAVQSSGQC